MIPLQAAHALSHIGRSVVNGVVSTSLVLLPLSLSSSYVFQVMGKCLISIMILSAWHGLAVLPVLLSFLQPASYSDLRDSLGGKEGSDGIMATFFPEPEPETNPAVNTRKQITAYQAWRTAAL